MLICSTTGGAGARFDWVCSAGYLNTVDLAERAHGSHEERTRAVRYLRRLAAEKTVETGVAALLRAAEGLALLRHFGDGEAFVNMKNHLEVVRALEERAQAAERELAALRGHVRTRDDT